MTIWLSNSVNCVIELCKEAIRSYGVPTYLSVCVYLEFFFFRYGLLRTNTHTHAIHSYGSARTDYAYVYVLWLCIHDERSKEHNCVVACTQYYDYILRHDETDVLMACAHLVIFITTTTLHSYTDMYPYLNFTHRHTIDIPLKLSIVFFISSQMYAYMLDIRFDCICSCMYMHSEMDWHFSRTPVHITYYNIHSILID